MASKQSNLEKVTTEGSSSKASLQKKTAGQLLRKARLVKGYKVAQVVQKLNISEEYIKAIEHNDFKKLPLEPIYTIGFVRAYAQLVGLDSKEIVEMFKVDFLGPEAAEDPNTIIIAATTEPKSALPFMYIALAAGALILGMGYFASKKEHGGMPTAGFVTQQ